MRWYWPLLPLGLLFSPPAQGAPEPEAATWISWNAPPECRNTREVERQLTSLLGYEVAPQQLPNTQVRLSWNERRGWLVDIEVEQTAGQRGRRVHTRTCSDAYDVVALTLALIIAPDLAGAWEEAAPQETDDILDTSDEGSTGASSSWSPEPIASAPSPTEPAANPQLPSAPAEPVASVPSMTATTESSGLGVAGQARVDISSLSVPLWGGGGELLWRFADTELSLGGELLASGQTELRRAANRVQYSLGFGRLGVCQLFPITVSLRWSLCGAFQLGSLAVREQGGAELRANGLWSTFTAGSGLGASIGDSFRSDLRVHLAFPTFRHELSLTNGDLAHALPSVSVQITWSVGFDVTD